MTEREMIRLLSDGFPRSKDQMNAVFECDAELVNMNGQVWGMTIDEFTHEEDLFTSDDPVRLGRNLAICTLSDLFAAGVVPRFYMHTVSLNPTLHREFAEEMACGVRSVLNEVGCFLCGGDFGNSDSWRYCGFAAGPVPGQPVTRVLPDQPQTLWVTGLLGDANVSAFQGAQTPEFELRLSEASFIRENATGCIDTSGGLMDGVWTLSKVNPCMSFVVDMNTVPFDPNVIVMNGITGIPKEAALIGGAGEYELLFALPGSVTPVGIDATMIGKIVPGGKGVSIIRDGDTFPFSSPPPCPRSFQDLNAYVARVITTAEVLYEQ
ncbi:MAG: hypothetical protein HQ557_11125 [Bacteroidetes bacterium]|nr:hypothetical protein [Bacteroidota bacterium]